MFISQPTLTLRAPLGVFEKYASELGGSPQKGRLPSGFEGSNTARAPFTDIEALFSESVSKILKWVGFRPERAQNMRLLGE
jgi:hypothetical protein